MIISNRVSKIEQTVDARMQALMTPVDQLERNYDCLCCVSEYVGGFPLLPKDKTIASWRQDDARRARLMLASGCTASEAALSQYVEDYCLNEVEARELLTEIGELRHAVVRDMQAGLPGEQSEAGKRLVALLLKAEQIA
jgi:hypothetical protein